MKSGPLRCQVVQHRAAGAIFLNSYFGRVLVPLGAPFGFIRKGPAKK